MELRTLTYFVAVVDAGTVSAAADRVRVTQPSLSRQVRQLERDLGVDLFERHGGRLVLSSAGRSLLPLARDVLASADALRTAARVRAEGGLDRVTIAAPATTLTDVVSPFLASLAPDDPTPSVVETDPLDVDEALRRGADLVVTTRRPRRPLRSAALPELPVWAFVPADHPWGGRESVGLAELLEQVVVTVPPTFAARQVLDAVVEREQRWPASLVEASSGTVAQALAAAGRGVAVVSDDSRYGLHGVRVRAGGGDLTVRLFVAWSSTHPAQETLAALAERLRTFVVDAYPGAGPASSRDPARVRPAQ
ncbi:LysR family transcriptional regulator [Aeromicrobium sp. 50.2.37]|uniref:LysR family transcriptional regulator n=1 Tax=Aeromicrobium sp. 50.2.37 TaxID=2969305 RepID=UPI0021502585|nr:LysR family transcriptional regulator [Aeromicrobium sp. 50.2.37]MCR4514294.1 LysR family transcriptional regulator [Aeromicrobium sp. 50.2.37]